MARTLAAPVSLADVPLKDARRRLKQSIDAGDIVRPSNHPDYMLVSSKSKPGFWHATSLAVAEREGHAYHGLCRHRIRVSWELHQARKHNALDARAV